MSGFRIMTLQFLIENGLKVGEQAADDQKEVGGRVLHVELVRQSQRMQITLETVDTMHLQVLG